MVALAASLVACGTGPAGGGQGQEPDARNPLILISFDGFRWDYPDRGVSPNLTSLAERGVRAERLIPSFPSKTFPNHYTLVTGLVPDHHGIVANTMWDPEFEALFSMSLREEVQNARWWGGEPVWVTTEKLGLATAPMFWPGSEAPIMGVRPSYWLPFDGEMTYAARIDWILSLLDRPPGERPVFLTLYFAQTDHAGHESGPDSPELESAIANVDAALGQLIEGLAERGIADEINLVVVSDHGMMATSRERVIFVDDYVDLEVARPVDWNPVLALWPDSEDVASVYQALVGAHPEMAVYRRDEIPGHLDYGTHRRTPPILGLASPGWSITNHAYYDELPERYDGGTHGYDPTTPEMHGIFIAAGPAFRSGVRVPAFHNVHVYPLIMAAIGLPPAESDGSLEAVPGILAP
jgi:predicted AlkP superfamily pyrophosphatase or phosphodiesterase